MLYVFDSYRNLNYLRLTLAYSVSLSVLNTSALLARGHSFDDSDSIICADGLERYVQNVLKKCLCR